MYACDVNRSRYVLTCADRWDYQYGEQSVSGISSILSSQTVSRGTRVSLKRTDLFSVTPIDIAIWSTYVLGAITTLTNNEVFLTCSGRREFNVGLFLATVPTLRPLWPVVSSFITRVINRFKPSRHNREPHFGNIIADRLRQQTQYPCTTTTSVYAGGGNSLQALDDGNPSMLPQGSIQKAVKLDIIVEDGSKV